MKKIYFLHIPKTGGTSINRFFRSKFSDNMYLDHFENNLGILDVFLKNHSFYLSGHVPYPRIKDKLDNITDLHKIVFLRDPYEQLISHISWVHNLMHDQLRLENHPPEVQILSKFLNQFDFSKSKDIQIMVRELSSYGIAAFDNRQIRYLADPSDDNLVDQSDLHKALRNIVNFNSIGVFEYFVKSFLEISNSLNIDSSYIPSENNFNNKVIKKDLINDEYKESLYPLVKYDIMLYNKAKNLTFNRK